MTDFVTRDDDNLGVGRILTSPTMYALYDNLFAMADGAAGAPRIQTPALDDGVVTDAKLNATVTSTGRDWVLARNAAAATGAVGTYAWLLRPVSGASFTAGSTYAGSSLRYAGIKYREIGTDAAWSGVLGGTPSGTWRAVGAQAGLSGYYPGTMFLRIS